VKAAQLRRAERMGLLVPEILTGSLPEILATPT
jgi:hypothetical protein